MGAIIRTIIMAAVLFGIAVGEAVVHTQYYECFCLSLCTFIPMYGCFSNLCSFFDHVTSVGIL